MTNAEEVIAKSPSAAFLFAYQPNPDKVDLFEEGYRRHLYWHKKNNDPLTWYAWYVTFGSRLGLFVDGTFGSPFGALDHRVDPAGDQADFFQTTAPFAEPKFRSAYRLREDLSTSTLLEAGRPSPHLEVVHVKVAFESKDRFEQIIKQSRDRQAESLSYTWYELVVGGEHLSYMLMIPRHSWAEIGGRSGTLSTLMTDAEITGRNLSRSPLTSITSELWSYRADLSYFPEQ